MPAQNALYVTGLYIVLFDGSVNLSTTLCLPSVNPGHHNKVHGVYHTYIQQNHSTGEHARPTKPMTSGVMLNPVPITHAARGGAQGQWGNSERPDVTGWTAPWERPIAG